MSSRRTGPAAMRNRTGGTAQPTTSTGARPPEPTSTSTSKGAGGRLIPLVTSWKTCQSRAVQLLAAEQAAAVPDYWTYAVAIIAGLGSGLGAAYVAGRSNREIAVLQRRGEASAALWAYHRTLVGLANASYSSAGLDFDTLSLSVTTATLAEVREAQQAAHEYATFLPRDSQYLVRDAAIDQAHPEASGFDQEMKFAESTQALASELERTLIAEFGQEDRRHPLRSRRGFFERGSQTKDA